MTLIGLFLNLFKRKNSSSGNGPKDKIGIAEDVEIKIIRDGKVVKKIKKRGHTWTNWGLEQIANVMAGATTVFPSRIIVVYNGTASEVVATNFSKKAGTDSGVYFEYSGKVGTGTTLSNITSFVLKGNEDSQIFSTVTVSGFKPADMELLINWRNKLQAT